MQRILRKYHNNLLSFEHNLMNLTFHGKGRYFGFDAITRTAALTFRLDHTGYNLRYKDEIDSVIGPIGMVLTPQGVIIQEDAPIAGISIDTNAGNANTRFDLVVLNHSFVNLSNPPAATYSIIKGNLSDSNVPTLADALKQTLLGILEIGPGVSDINNVIYRKSKSPDSGDSPDARLNEPNSYNSIQAFNKSPNPILTPAATITGADGGKLWELPGDANLYEIAPVGNTYLDAISIKNLPLHEGTELDLVISETVFLRNTFTSLPSEWLALGYRPFAIHPSFYTNPTADTPRTLNPPTGNKWVLNIQLVGGVWLVKDIQGFRAFTKALQDGYDSSINTLTTNVTNLTNRVTVLDTHLIVNQASSLSLPLDFTRNKFIVIPDKYSSPLIGIYFAFDFANAKPGAKTTIIFKSDDGILFNPGAVNHTPGAVFIKKVGALDVAAGGSVFAYQYIFTATFIGIDPVSNYKYLEYNITKREEVFIA